MALYQRDALVGHRPTWSMGVNRGAKRFREKDEIRRARATRWGGFK